MANSFTCITAIMRQDITCITKLILEDFAITKKDIQKENNTTLKLYSWANSSSALSSCFPVSEIPALANRWRYLSTSSCRNAAVTSQPTRQCSTARSNAMSVMTRGGAHVGRSVASSTTRVSAKVSSARAFTPYSDSMFLAILGRFPSLSLRNTEPCTGQCLMWSARGNGTQLVTDNRMRGYGVVRNVPLPQ